MEASRGVVDVPPHVIEFMRAQKTLTLASASANGVPRAATLLYVSDGPTVYVWVRAESNTSRNLEQNPVASFAIDEYADDLRHARGIQGTGEVRTVLSGEEIARIAMLFGDKFPDLSPGASTIGISFSRIEPIELQFIDNTQSEPSSEQFGPSFHRDLVYSALSDLPYAGGATIASRLERFEATAGTVVVRQGGPADKFLIVVDGELEIVREDGGAAETVGTLGPGDFFGEVSILADTPRATTLRAVKDTTLLAMERDAFKELMAESLNTTADFDQILRARLEGGGR